MTVPAISAGGRLGLSIAFGDDQACAQELGPGRLPRPEAVSLLSQIVARLGDAEPPVVQFVPGSDHPGGDEVAQEFAVASVARFGRTVLISNDRMVGNERPALPGRAAVSADAAGACLPDSSVPGLHYLRLPAGPRTEAALGRLVGPPMAFGMVVVDSLFPAVSPGAIAVARFCRGSVVTVAAGLTSLTDLRMVVTTLETAGATVMGTVLHGARHLPTRGSWRRGRV